MVPENPRTKGAAAAAALFNKERVRRHGINNLANWNAISARIENNGM